MPNNKIHIGTSGWQYDDWKGKYYPASIKNEDLLGEYQKAFSTVEVNNSFYQLPSEKTLIHWAEKTREDFKFAMKANRYITHMKKLNEPEEALEKMFGRFDVISGKIAVILFQLPPNWKANAERLKDFFGLLPDDHKYTIEFRNESWYDDEIYDVLKQQNAALCIHDIDGKLTPAELTADFTYIRLHGPNKRYEGSYSDEQLSEWKDRIENFLQETNEVFCYFNNDTNANAPINAEKLNGFFA
mgnify:CR=1 FL=1